MTVPLEQVGRVQGGEFAGYGQPGIITANESLIWVNRCTCGHEFPIHSALDGHCEGDCTCKQFNIRGWVAV